MIHFPGSAGGYLGMPRHHRGMTEDTQFQEHTIEKVTPEKEGSGFMLEMEGSGCIYEHNSKGLPLPFVGQTVRLYGKGMGYMVRGLVVGDHAYRYRTADEQDAKRLADNAAKDEEKRQKFKVGLEQWQADLKELPDVFRQRIVRFSRKEDWDWDLGPYEMFVCKEAHKIIRQLINNSADDAVEGVVNFHKASQDEQRKLLPDMDYDNHSGNTFGAACALARGYFMDADAVPHMHGALCPLVGCAEYGCFAATGP